MALTPAASFVGLPLPPVDVKPDADLPKRGAALVHAYAQVSMIIRDRQSRWTYPPKRWPNPEAARSPIPRG